MKKPLKKNPFYLHWFRVDPFKRMVFLVVGDAHAAVKYAKRHGFRHYDFSDILKILDENLPFKPGAKLDECGKTVYHPSGDSLVYFAEFPTPGTLVHEIFHATCHIMETVGVADKNGETDAYVLDDLFSHFFASLENDKAQEIRK
jgi:hypothetical protein